jgi:AraC-like DNA-binding protein
MKLREALKYLAFLIPLFFLIPVIYAILQKPLILFPWTQRVYRTDAYSDEGISSENSVSTIDAFTVNVDSITLAYTLRAGVTYPYAGMYFSTEFNEKFTDLSGYDFIKISMAAASRDIYQIKIKAHLEGHTIESDTNTRCPLEKAIVLEDFMKEYRIPLSEFEFLDWWFERQHLIQSNYNKLTLLTKTASINFQHTKKLKPGEEERGRFIIKEFSFYKSFTMLYIFSGTGFLLSFIIVAFVLFQRHSKKREKGESFQFVYSPVELTSYSDEDTKRLVTFIMENYTDPDLTVTMLYRQTGLSRRRIASLIKKKYKLPFKQLINKIRCEEAGRLLKQTDRNITDIAMALGFSSASYFFQVFKSAFHMSPSDFRKKYSTDIS